MLEVNIPCVAGTALLDKAVQALVVILVLDRLILIPTPPAVEIDSLEPIKQFDEELEVLVGLGEVASTERCPEFEEAETNSLVVIPVSKNLVAPSP